MVPALAPPHAPPQAVATAPYAADADRWRAVRANDRAADGHFAYAVTSTGIYCRPIAQPPTEARQCAVFSPARARGRPVFALQALPPGRDARQPPGGRAGPPNLRLDRRGRHGSTPGRRPGRPRRAGRAQLAPVVPGVSGADAAAVLGRFAGRPPEGQFRAGEDIAGAGMAPAMVPPAASIARRRPTWHDAGDLWQRRRRRRYHLRGGGFRSAMCCWRRPRRVCFLGLDDDPGFLTAELRRDFQPPSWPAMTPPWPNRWPRWPPI